MYISDEINGYFYIIQYCGRISAPASKIFDTMVLINYVIKKHNYCFNRYNDWGCVECCSGDLCNYYVTVSNH